MVADASEAQGELVSLEQRFWLEGGGDPDFWRAHFVEDGLVALPFGIMDKAQTVDAMAQGRPWAEVEMQDLRILPVGDGSALMVYRARGRWTDDDTQGYEAVVASLYVRRGGAWQLLFHQQSPPADVT